MILQIDSVEEELQRIRSPHLTFNGNEPVLSNAPHTPHLS
jgi:hypothetical protein